eukprot:TRINITY_DN6331_c0_g1_i2.p1 TRINITY_DN6331_c0_g1~~TRINITY_DN6331_c0_g1_i2.p1  ORF type:complete len:163 (-),score=21.19 TRINITY_DN6331_c0_g1_i2:84-572(-)
MPKGSTIPSIVQWLICTWFDESYPVCDIATLLQGSSTRPEPLACRRQTGEIIQAPRPLVRGERWQTLACFNGLDGFCGWRHVKDSFDQQEFMQAFIEVVVPNIRPGMYVLIDGARTHPWEQLHSLVEARGAVLVPLPPYSPCLLYTSPSPRDRTRSRMPSSA